MKWLTLIFLVFLTQNLCAQSTNIVEHGRISEMMNVYVQSNQENDYIQAWRIQVVTTDDRRKMENARAKFNSLYPLIKTSWKHMSPWYHLKAGAYKTKLELQGFLIQVKKDFPGAIPIVDRVKKEELLSP